MKKHDPFPSEGNAGLVVAAAVDTLWIRCGYLWAQKNNILACHFKNEPAISSSKLLEQGNGVCFLERDVLSLKGLLSVAAGYLGLF